MKLTEPYVVYTREKVEEILERVVVLYMGKGYSVPLTLFLPTTVPPEELCISLQNHPAAGHLCVSQNHMHNLAWIWIWMSPCKHNRNAYPSSPVSLTGDWTLNLEKGSSDKPTTTIFTKPVPKSRISQSQPSSKTQIPKWQFTPPPPQIPKTEVCCMWQTWTLGGQEESCKWPFGVFPAPSIAHHAHLSRFQPWFWDAHSVSFGQHSHWS